MYSTRIAIESGLFHVERQCDALENAINENPGLVVDLSKTLIESVFRSILSDLRIDFARDESMNALFKKVRDSIDFVPPDMSGDMKVRVGLDRTLGSLSGAIQGLCVLRNSCGFASHGGDSSRTYLEHSQALLAAQAADAIVGYLYHVHIQALAPAQKTTYEQNSEFNDLVDRDHDLVRIFECEFKPSEILCTMEPESYVVYLSEFNTRSSDVDQGGEE